jgi:type IV pilus assembly protein PilB
MGVAAFNVAGSVSLITAQRLVRRLCEHCKRPMDAAEIDFLFSSLNSQDQKTIPSHMRAQATPCKALGCNACDKGYKGRIGLYQVMPISEAMKSLIMQDSDAQALASQAALEDVRTLRQAGWLKVLQGITSVEEVMALTHHG